MTQEIFLKACENAEKNPIHKKIVNQIIAVDDFVAFKRLMCKRNAELNKQALAMLQEQAAKTKPEAPKEPIPTPEEKTKNAEELLKQQEEKLKSKKGIDKDMQEAIRIAQLLDRQEEEDMMKKALEISQKIEDERQNKFKEEEDEEMKMIQEAIEASRREEEARLQKEKEETQKLLTESERAEADRKAKEEAEQRAKELVEAKKKALLYEEEQRAKQAQQHQATPQAPELPQVQIEAPVKASISNPAPSQKLIEIEGAAMSEAELRKLEELRKLKNKKKEKQNQEEEKQPQSSLKADALPPVMMKRQGQFEMIPDFLQKGQVQRDMNAINETDMMSNVFKKQDEENQAQPSMSELFAQKRKAMEEKLAKGPGDKGKPSESEVAERKAKLLAQRDALRKQKEAKRQEELEMFNQKTETKEDLFNELKKMDSQVKEKQQKAEQERRLEMMRKARADIEHENKLEQQMKIQPKQQNAAPKQPGNIDNDNDDWFDNLKVVGTGN